MRCFVIQSNKLSQSLYAIKSPLPHLALMRGIVFALSPVTRGSFVFSELLEIENCTLNVCPWKSLGNLTKLSQCGGGDYSDFPMRL